MPSGRRVDGRSLCGIVVMSSEDNGFVDLSALQTKLQKLSSVLLKPQDKGGTREQRL